MPLRCIDTLSFPACALRWSQASKRARNGLGPLLAPNTRLENHRDQYGDGDYVVRFYNTAILTFRPDGSVVYHSGGYRTVTTLDRLNRFGPARVYKRKGEWRISHPAPDGPPVDAPYQDGYVVPSIDQVRPEWLTDTVRVLADQPGNEPLLADALQDAGCDDNGLLARLRGTDRLAAIHTRRAVEAQCS